MKRLQQWHDTIKYMPADRYFGGLSELLTGITVCLCTAYVTTGGGIYFWTGLAAAICAFACLEKSAHARRTARNDAHDRDIRGGQHDRL